LNARGWLGKKQKSWSRWGAGIFLIFVLLALSADFISPYNPRERFDPYSAPDNSFILGTNDLGNDILSELIHGTRVSLLVGFGAALISTIIGIFIGLVSGYFKGIVDEILMGITDIFLLIPRIPLIIILAAFLKPSAWITALVIGLLWWTSTARIVRAKTIQVREMNFIQSSKCLGFSHAHIIFSDIFPNIFYVVLPKFLLTIASAMITEASLSFLGLGDSSMKSWGMMIHFAFQKGAFINGMWWWFIPPGICITLSVFSAVLLGFSFEKEELSDMGIE
jgi:peptide/nickel transport system permease protein